MQQKISPGGKGFAAKFVKVEMPQKFEDKLTSASIRTTSNAAFDLSHLFVDQ